MQRYPDIYLRSSVGDTGDYPSYTRMGGDSPDIIPAQLRVIDPAELIKSYPAEPVNTNIYPQQINNIYLRAKNLSSGAAAGTMSLYYALSS